MRCLRTFLVKLHLMHAVMSYSIIVLLYMFWYTNRQRKIVLNVKRYLTLIFRKYPLAKKTREQSKKENPAKIFSITI